MGLALACTLAAALAGGEGDMVQLKSGKTLRGRILFEDASSVVLRQDAKDATLPRTDIEHVESRVRWLSKVLDEATLLGEVQVGELAQLAREAEAKGLAGEARNFWWQLLLIDPRDESANLALGNRQRGAAWTIPMGGRFVDWEKRVELARDWGTAWELETMHYRLRSNLPLRTSLDAALDLERFYRAFYDQFGSELRLYDVQSPMSVCLHADSASYPETANEFGHYEPETDIVQVNCAGGLVWETLAHELTHQLLFDTIYREHSASGEVPAWLGEGLAEYVAAGIVSWPNLVFEPGRVQARHFQAQARAKDPLDLTRVLALSVGDYTASSGRDLKYAQSYTLVHFLLHGDDHAYREGFLDYLRSLYRGKGSATDLKRFLKVDWRKLGSAWEAYVRRLAG